MPQQRFGMLHRGSFVARREDTSESEEKSTRADPRASRCGTHTSYSYARGCHDRRRHR